MSASEDQKQKLVQEGISRHNFEQQEAEIAVDSFFKEKRSNESFGQYLIRDGWIGGDHKVSSGLPVEADDDDEDSNYYLSSGLSNGARVVEGEESEEEDDDDDDDIYSSKEGLIAGLNASNHPAVRSKVGADAKVSCVGAELHKDDRRFLSIQELSHPSDLIKAAKKMALDIDNEDRGQIHTTFAKDFLEDVIATAEKEFGRDRDDFTKDHCARVVAEFLRHTEDKKRGEVVMAHTKAYIGNLQAVTSGIESDDDDGPAPIMHGIHRVPCRPAKSKRASFRTQKKAQANGGGGTASVGQRVDYVLAYKKIVNHHFQSQEDEIWVSARNVAAMTEAAAKKRFPGIRRDIASPLIQAAYYCASAIAAVPAIVDRSPTASEATKTVVRREAARTLKMMTYRALLRRQFFPGVRGKLDQARANKFDLSVGAFQREGYSDFNREAFVMPRKSEGFFTVPGLAEAEVETLRQAEADIAGLLQDSDVMSTDKAPSESSRRQIMLKATQHMSQVVPAILAMEKGGTKLLTLTLWTEWAFTHLYQTATHYPSGRTTEETSGHGDWLLSSVLNHLKPLVPGKPDLRLSTIVSRFDRALNIDLPQTPSPLSEQQQQQGERREANGGGGGRKVIDTFPDQPRVYQRTKARIGGKMLAFDKSRSVLGPRRNKISREPATAETHRSVSSSTTTKKHGPIDLRQEMENVAVEILADKEKQIRKANPDTTIILLIPVKGSKAWKSMESWVRSARRGLNEGLNTHVPAYIICKTGKFEFTSLTNDVYSAVSKQSRDLRHVRAGFDVKFVDSKMQRVEYKGGGPTFHIAEVDFGDTMP